MRRHVRKDQSSLLRKMADYIQPNFYNSYIDHMLDMMVKFGLPAVDLKKAIKNKGQSPNKILRQLEKYFVKNHGMECYKDFLDFYDGVDESKSSSEYAASDLDRLQGLFRHVGPTISLNSLDDEGFCHGFSVVKSVMQLEGSADWWDEVLTHIASWDPSNRAALDEKLVLKCRPDETTNLRALFDRAINYVAINQATKNYFNDSLYDANYRQTDLLSVSAKDKVKFEINNKKGNDISSINSCEHVIVKFSKSEMAHFFKENKPSLASNVVTVSTINHACTMHYDENKDKWLFYDPNNKKGDWLVFDTAEDLVEEIVSSQGTRELAFTFASYNSDEPVNIIRPSISNEKQYKKVKGNCAGLLLMLDRPEAARLIAEHDEDVDFLVELSDILIRKRHVDPLVVKAIPSMISQCEESYDLRSNLAEFLEKRVKVDGDKMTGFQLVAENIESLLDLIDKAKNSRALRRAVYYEIKESGGLCNFLKSKNDSQAANILSRLLQACGDGESNRFDRLISSLLREPGIEDYIKRLVGENNLLLSDLLSRVSDDAEVSPLRLVLMECIETSVSSVEEVSSETTGASHKPPVPAFTQSYVDSVPEKSVVSEVEDQCSVDVKGLTKQQIVHSHNNSEIKIEKLIGKLIDNCDALSRVSARSANVHRRRIIIHCLKRETGFRIPPAFMDSLNDKVAYFVDHAYNDGGFVLNGFSPAHEVSRERCLEIERCIKALDAEMNKHDQLSDALSCCASGSMINRAKICILDSLDRGVGIRLAAC